MADKLRALKLREARAWKVIDAYMVDRKVRSIPAHVRLEAAVFVLKRLYPEKDTTPPITIQNYVIVRHPQAIEEEAAVPDETARV